MAIAHQERPSWPRRRRRTGSTSRSLPYPLIAPAGLLVLGFIAFPIHNSATRLSRRLADAGIGEYGPPPCRPRRPSFSVC
ncbi:hypothetical protein [Streptomyces sp. NPDC127098]|uniref:hypothetical protein n=1 Tax=Streptomyces sp. NPDC127098 TaxID=3347137 RepID=UPI00365E072D